METADMFLVFGEKIAELQTAGHHAFFSWSGHVSYYHFWVFDGHWAVGKPRAIDLDSHNFKSYGKFLQKCLNEANLLMLKGK